MSFAKAKPGKPKTITAEQRAILDRHAAILTREHPGMKVGELSEHVHHVAEAMGIEPGTSLGAPYDHENAPEEIARARLLDGLRKIYSEPKMIRRPAMNIEPSERGFSAPALKSIAALDPNDPTALRKGLAEVYANPIRPGRMSKGR